MTTAAAGSVSVQRRGGARGTVAPRLVDQHLASLPHGLPRLRHLQELHAQLLRQGMHRDTSAVSKLIASYALLRRRQVPACRRVFSAADAFSGSPYSSSTTLLSNTLLRAIPAHQQDMFTYSFVKHRHYSDRLFTWLVDYSFDVELGSF
jgi:hypothetical protein